MDLTNQAAADRPTRRPAAAWLTGAGCAAVLAAVVIPPDLSVHGPVLCPSRLLFGLPCPGCGLIRSWGAVAHGDGAGAFTSNWSGPISFVAVALGSVAMIVLIAWRGADDATAVALRVLRSQAVAAVVVVWICYGAVRAVAYLANLSVPGIVQVT